jgi:hypothetical protein
VEKLTRQLAETQVLEGLPRQLGLDNKDAVNLIKLAAELTRNPTEGARRVLEFALSKGANLKDIVNDEFIPNLTLAATRRLLDERLGPLAQERKQDQSVDEDTAVQQRQARQFMADYPEATVHADVIADQMQKIEQEYSSKGLKVDKYVIAEQAFQRLERFCHDNKLDITQPLAPQIQARSRDKAPSGERRPGRQSPRPIPNGSGGGEMQSRRQNVANADDSYNSIVREAMSEAGYQL